MTQEGFRYISERRKGVQRMDVASSYLQSVKSVNILLNVVSILIENMIPLSFTI